MREPISLLEVILYVNNQSDSADFYRSLLDREPVLDVPGMTEFSVTDNCRLGLMPSAGIAKILGRATPHPDTGAGVPRCELYFAVEDPAAEFDRAVRLGAHPVSPAAPRGWGDVVSYVADLDGHVLGFARKMSQDEQATS